MYIACLYIIFEKSYELIELLVHIESALQFRKLVINVWFLNRSILFLILFSFYFRTVTLRNAL